MPTTQCSSLHTSTNSSVYPTETARAVSVMSVVNMPTPQCSLLHTSTISPVYPTECTHIKRATAARVLVVGHVPTPQCSLLHSARSVSHIRGLEHPAADCVLIQSPVPATQHAHSHVNTHEPAPLPRREPLHITLCHGVIQPAAAISEPPSPLTVTARLAHTPPQAPRPALCGGRDPEAIRPLAMSANAWKAIPGVSKWVLNTVIKGYSLQFTRRPPRFRARVETQVKADAAHLLHTEIANLLHKGAIERVHPPATEAGVYSRYFLVPKKGGALRPILDLRYLNKALVKRPFKMLTTSQILAQIRPGDWFISLDLKDAYFQIQIIPRHRPFLRFAFDGQVFQYTVLPFGLSLAPRTFTKCMDAALAPLRSRGMRILNYLDDWLIIAHSTEELVSHREALLGHLESLGLSVNWDKSSLTPSQSITFLGIDLDSAAMTARLSAQRARCVRHLAASIRVGKVFPLKTFQRLLGHMASAAAVLQLGLLRMRPLQCWLRSEVPRKAWISGRAPVRVTQRCVSALQPWLAAEWYQRGVTMGVIAHRKVVSTDASNMGWGATHEGNPICGPWSKTERSLHINCLEMLAVEKALKHFLPLLRGHHVLVRSDNMSVVSYVNRQGGIRSRTLRALAERLLSWAQGPLRSLRAAHVPGRLNDGPDRLSRDNVPPGEWSLHRQTVQTLWRRFGEAQIDLFAASENAQCQRFFSKREDALAQTWPSVPLYAFPPISMLPQVLARIRETNCAVLLIAPRWENQTWFPELMRLADAAPWPIPVRRDLLSQARGSILHPRPEHWSLHAWEINGYPSICQKE